MFALNINSYLQSQCSSVNPRIINRSVDKAKSQPVIEDCSYYEPPFFRVTSDQPNLPTENSDPTRRPVAFGRWALPILRRDIHSDDDGVVIQSLLSLSDLVHDPERAYEAVALKIPDRLSDKLLDPLSPVREAAVLVLQILAGYRFGREAIIGNDGLLEHLTLCLGDSQISVRLKTASCFEMIARSWTSADVLVDRGLTQILLEIINRQEMSEIIAFHLETLKSLMYDCGKCIVIKENGFRILMQLLNHEDNSIVSKALNCLSIITSTRKGKKLALQKDLLKILTRLVHYGDTQIITSATSVLMFCTVKTRAKHLAAEVKSLPKRLVLLANNPLNIALQMFALKALTNICEHPMIRKKVADRYTDDLTNLQVAESNKEYKNTLLKTLFWMPEKME